MERFATTAPAVLVSGGGARVCTGVHAMPVLAIAIVDGLARCQPCASAARAVALNIPSLRTRELGALQLVREVSIP